ncbi:MAG: LytTR family DNA-binding domain-containing protein [Bacteroidia bacterium]|nr:LytTR family DNA-binding domain-containing protein [Bacteroidia bacterium]
MKLKCLIVDDEPLALDVLENFIKRIPDLELVGRCENAMQAIQTLKEKQVDLLFTDIEMPEFNGIELVKSLNTKPLIIFTTAHPEYAVQGYELDIVDYLLKPIAFDRFVKSVNKAGELMNFKKGEPHGKDELDYIFIKSEQKYIKVNFSDILYIEALADYVKVHTPEKRIITLQTMKNLEDKLPSEQFVRVHRSFIIALDKINSISGNVIYMNKDEVPIGKNFREEFFKIIQQNNLLS